MHARLDFRAASPAAFAAMLQLNAAVHACGLAPALLELVKLRVSQLNGCAFCIELHAAAARRAGIDAPRLQQLGRWRESALYGDAERAALRWAERLTRLSGDEVSDVDYDRVRMQFDETQIAHLSLAVAEINAWNRLMLAARMPAQPARSAADAR